MADGDLCYGALRDSCGYDFPYNMYILIRDITEVRELVFLLSASAIK